MKKHAILTLNKIFVTRLLDILPREYHTIVNDIRNFVFGLAGASVYGSCRSRKQKFVMSSIITIQNY